VGESRVLVAGALVSVGGGGSVAISVGLVQAARIAIKKSTYNINRKGLRITIPPFDLGTAQIIHLKIL
jgi:hypothetical protein